MKKTLLTLLILTFAASLCFAQQPMKPAAPVAAAPAATPPASMKAFVGKVESISLADAAKGTKSEIVVVNEAGKKLTFLVKSTATIYDAASKTITLDKIKKDDKVRVKYMTSKEGVEEATSLRIMP